MICYIKENLALDYVHTLMFERKYNFSGTWSVPFLRWKPGEARINKRLNNEGTVNQSISYQVHSYPVITTSIYATPPLFCRIFCGSN
jgi:hypothetical protein